MESTYQIQSDYADDLYSEYDSDYESYNYDDDESLGSLIDKGLGTVGRLVTGGVNAAVGTAQRVGKGIGTILGVNPTPASTNGIQNASNLAGTIQTNTGKTLPVNLPSSIATKEDVYILQAAIRKINTELKKVADTTTNNGVALSKLSGEVKVIDEKHIAATKKQNELIHRLGRGVDKLQADMRATKQQAQMQMMLSILMQPEVEKVKFTGSTNQNVVDDNQTEYPVSTSSSDDKSLLPLLMMGGMSGEGGNDFSSNPMAMILLMKAFED